jgi:hypothetical protein
MNADEDIHPREMALILIYHSIFLDFLWLSSICLRQIVSSDEWKEVILALEKTSWLLFIMVFSFIPWTTRRLKRKNNA